MTAEMLSAYYNRGYDSESMFENLKISKDFSYKKHLNKYDVVHLNIQDFLSESEDIAEMIADIGNGIVNET